jgi:cystathionine beta-lyase
LDNTFLAPCLQRALDLGADITVYSATKYLAGHNDTVAGLVVEKDPGLAEKVFFLQNSIGAVLGPQDPWQVLRGLKTLKVRMEESQRSAGAVAEWLTGQKKVHEVIYPGLVSHPGFAIHRSQVSRPGAVLSLRLSTLELTKKLPEGTRLAAFAVSLGGVESTSSRIRRRCLMPPCPLRSECRGGSAVL